MLNEANQLRASACCIWASFCALFCLSAHGYIAPPELETGVVECNSIHLNTYDCAKGIERKALSKQQNLAHRSSRKLVIKAASKTITLIDTPADSGEKFMGYAYLGFVKKINSHVLYIQYWEGGSYMVINHNSGQAAYPSGYPVTSPNGKFFLSISEDMFAGYNPNNVELWRVTPKGFQRIKNFDVEWGSRTAKWANTNRAVIKKICHSPSEQNPAGLVACGNAELSYSNSEWKLVE